MEEDCIFCNKILPEQILFETKFFKIVLDINPVQGGHLLIIAKSHFMDIRELSDEALLDLIKTEQQLVGMLYELAPVDGVTIAENNGSIMDSGTHLHIHVIPRYQQDGFWDNQEIAQKTLNLEKLKEKLGKLS